MKNEINTEKVIKKMISENIKVVEIDKDNHTFICDNGIEYPIMDGCEDFTVDQLQIFIDNAKSATINILKSINDNE